jgi:hypothetical protein
MGRLNKKVTTGVADNDPPTIKDQNIEKDATKIQVLQKQAKLKNKDSKN